MGGYRFQVKTHASRRILDLGRYNFLRRSTKHRPPTSHRPQTTDHSDTYHRPPTRHHRPPTRHHRPPTTYLKNNRPPTKGTIDHRSEKPPTTDQWLWKNRPPTRTTTDHWPDHGCYATDQNNNRPPTRLRLLSHRPHCKYALFIARFFCHCDFMVQSASHEWCRS